MAGYSKQFNSLPGDKIDVELFDDEYTLVDGAFDATTGHKHDNSVGEGAYVPMLAESEGLTKIECDTLNEEITFSTKDGVISVPQLKLVNGALEPILTSDINLGTNTERFAELYLSGFIDTPKLKFLSGSFAVDIADEDDMISDSVEFLATQQSIKAYVDTEVTNSPGLFIQRLYNTNETDVALSATLSDYLTITITVSEGSYVHIHSHMGGSGSIAAGTVYGAIYRDVTAVSAEEFVIADDSTATDFQGSTGRVDMDGPLTAGTYTYSIKMRELTTTGLGVQATLLLLEESA